MATLAAAFQAGLGGVHSMSGTTTGGASNHAVQEPSTLLSALIIGPQHVPTNAVLGRMEIGPSFYRQVWYCPKEESEGSGHPTVWVAASVRATPESAVAGVNTLSGTIQSRLIDVSDGPAYASFADSAWRPEPGTGGGRLLFTRGNIMGDVYVSSTIGEEALLSVARALSRKIDAVLASKPEPVPVLHFLGHGGTRDGATREEQGIEGAWAVKKLQES